jgi:hypothetical protein
MDTHMFDNDPFCLNPVQFFALSCDCFYLPKKEQVPTLTRYALPSTHRLTREKHFAKLAMGWNEEGIGVYVQVDQPANESRYPGIAEGDSVELFFDTRDLKSSGFNTRFCHHFFFLPQAVEGVDKGEKTHFRTEDRHSLCDSQALYCQTQLRKNDYQMKIFIPTQCLYGYDPKQFDRLGFTYRINRPDGDSQHFAVVSQDYQIEQQPSLWGSLKLVK